MHSNQLVVLYDGKCPMCIGWIRFLIDRDGNDRLRFASLDSQWTSDFMRKNHLGYPQADSVLVWDGVNLWQQSEAIERIVAVLPGIWQLAKYLGWLPRGMCNRLYDAIARNRHKWFGKRDQCWLPAVDVRIKFLDLGEPDVHGNSHASDSSDH